MHQAHCTPERASLSKTSEIKLELTYIEPAEIMTLCRMDNASEANYKGDNNQIDTYSKEPRNSKHTRSSPRKSNNHTKGQWYHWPFHSNLSSPSATPQSASSNLV